MKKLVLAGLLVLPFIAPAQTKVLFDTIFSSALNKDFFRRNPVVDSVGFNSSKRLYLYAKTFWRDTSFNQASKFIYKDYNLDFLGDIYLFEKNYGRLSLPDKEMRLVSSKSCYPSYTFYGIIRADSIRMHMEYYCPGEKNEDEDRVFMKVEKGPHYKDGIGNLQHKMTAAFKNKQMPIKCLPADSVLMYDILVPGKDSCLKSVELIDGQYSAFEQFIMEELKHNCGWLPGTQSGRDVTAYNRIFIRLNADKTITVQNEAW